MLEFPELCVAIRKKAKLNQKEFAKKLGVSYILIACVETYTRSPSKKLALRLAKALGVPSMMVFPFLTVDFLAVDTKRELSSLDKRFHKTLEEIQFNLINTRALCLKVK